MLKCAQVLFFVALFSFAFGKNNCSSLIREIDFNPFSPLIPFNQMPTESGNANPAACSGNSVCQYSEEFSCLYWDYSGGYPGELGVMDCKTAYTRDEFPLCAGRVTVKSSCQDFKCCESFNHASVNYFNATYGHMIRASQVNIFMQFYSSTLPINCHSYSDDGMCQQYFEYIASSDWTACGNLQNQFNSADSMAFDLF